MKCLWHLNGAVVVNNAIMPYLVTTLSSALLLLGFGDRRNELGAAARRDDLLSRLS